MTVCVGLAVLQAPAERVTIRVDAGARRAPMTPMWAFFGYDEPNYTYTPNGTKLLDELSALSPVPVFVRAHNLLTTGDGTPAMKWGSTNAYTEDASGRPIYDWTIVDRIFDTYVKRKMKPLVEIGFMPEALSTKPQPYQHDWAPGLDYNRIYTGWSYPPNDYDKWRELIARWAEHAVGRYGRPEVESWFWEVWNEPDIGYWHGTPEEYQKLYDYAADGLKRALPTARIGGPHVTGPNGARTQQIPPGRFSSTACAGRITPPGRPGRRSITSAFTPRGRRVFSTTTSAWASATSCARSPTASASSRRFPELRDTPIIIGESDPGRVRRVRRADESGERLPQWHGLFELYRRADRADLRAGRSPQGEPARRRSRGRSSSRISRTSPASAISPRTASTSRSSTSSACSGACAAIASRWTSSGALPLDQVRDTGVRDRPDVNALATRASRRSPSSSGTITTTTCRRPRRMWTCSIEGVPQKAVEVTHDRVDATHSNAYEAWKRMGSPQAPTRAQLQDLERAGRLQPLEPPRKAKVEDGRVRLTFTLPRQGVSLFRLKW